MVKKVLKNHPTQDANTRITPRTAQADIEGQGPETEVHNTDLFVADAGAGFDEGVDAGAYALPYISILQALSPQVQRGHQAYINGANPGLLYNTVTKEISETVDGRVVRRTHTFCKWELREKGGGFLGETEATVDAVQAYAQLKRDDKNRAIDADGKHITEHRNFYCQIIRNGHAIEQIVVSMASSQLAVARKWNYNIASKSARVLRVWDDAEGHHEAEFPVAPSEIWRLGTEMKTKGNNSWYLWTFQHIGRHSNAKLYGEVRAAIAQAKEVKLLARPTEAPEESEEI